MKTYTVVKYFTDLQDNNHPYNVGDTFPRAGVSVSSERISELSGSNNKQGKPLIEEVITEEPVVEEPIKDEPANETPVETPKPKSSRKRRGNN